MLKSLLSRLTSSWRYSAGLFKTRALDPGAEAWLRGEDLDAGGITLTNAYQQVVWVYRAINVLAEQVANVPFRFSVGEAGGESLITDGPLVDFYTRPHPHINRFQYWELRIMWLMLRGECFRIPVFSDNDGRAAHLPGGRRRLSRVLILDPANFQHILQDNELIGWRYTGLGPNAPLASQVFLPEEVWFERLPNPFDFWRGLPPLYAAATATRTDFAAGAFMRGLIENNADAGIIVRTEQQLTTTQREQMVAYLNERKRRAGTADRPLLLTNGAEIVKAGLSSSDLQFLENRKFSRAEICAAFGVPEEIVTTGDHAKYDVMEGARLNFIENRVTPLCRRLEAEEDTCVKALDPSAVGWFDLDSLPIMQLARRNRLESARVGFGLGVPFNELNRVLDLGFKPLPWGDAGYVPNAMRPVGRQETAKTAVVSDRSDQSDQSDDSDRCALALPERLLGLLTQPAESRQIDAPGKPDRKTCRFLFEQRGRVLERLRSLYAESASFSEDLLDAVVDQPGEARLLTACFPADQTSAARNGATSQLSPRACFENVGQTSCLPVRAASCPPTAGQDAPQTGRPEACPTLFNHALTPHDVLAAVPARLREHLAAAVAQGQTHDQLAALIRSFYNHLA